MSDGTLGIKNNKLKYFQIETVSQGKAWGSFNKINPIYLEWKAYLDSFQKANDKSNVMKSQKFTSGLHFAWIMSE